MDNTDFGQHTQESLQSSFSAQLFFVWQILSKISTVQLVEVMAVTNAGALSAVGFVDVRVLTNQMTGERKAIPHETIYGIPYFRLQGGGDAVILDPKVGDIGMCGFAQRDISIVKKTKARANPGSKRMFDWADGLYFGGMLNGVPTQYVRFSASGIEVYSPTEILLRSPLVTVETDTFSVSATADIEMTAPEVSIAGTTGIVITSPLTAVAGSMTISTGLAVSGTYLGQTFSMSGTMLFHNATLVADGTSTFTFNGKRIDDTHTHPGGTIGSGTTGTVS